MENGAFRVVARNDVSADPDMDRDNCKTDPHSPTVDRCCTTRRLEPVLDITVGDVYAIEAGTGSILLLLADILRPGRILSVPADVGNTVSAVPSPNNLTVAMVRFIAVGKSTIQLHMG